MRIAEIYPCWQGEGKLTGKLSILIRTVGCNLRCAYRSGSKITKCDSYFTSWKPVKGRELSPQEILKECEKFGKINYVIISGGEPFLQPDLEDVTQVLKDTYHITIETNGSIYKRVYCDLYSICPKLKNSIPGSGPEREVQIRNRVNHRVLLQNFMAHPNIQIKFVVSREGDGEEIKSFQKAYSLSSDDIYLMPQGVTSSELNKHAQICHKLAMKNGWNYSDRIHIRVYGKRRKV
ncbi:MAG: 7-carboxy-7-deazaguanine synthase QueE [Nanoarchaeota archaeon]